jgi:meiotically up-regulated gene 157 (Mug157) protein
MATVGTETLNLAGMGNPVNANTSLIKSAFRPSDDATILQFFIPANAMMAVELKKTAKLMSNIGHEDKAKQLENLGREIEQAIWDHGVQQHPVFGKVFAYEVDGFGGSIYMDDANIPSLLALPDMGFVDVNDPVYVNTRKMILSKQGNPYYLNGRVFHGIGGPHIGVRNAWPMSHLVAIRTSNNEAEISELLELVKQSTSGLGLMHESVSVDIPHSFTRPWFSWANSEFAKTIFDVADRYPHLLFGSAPAPVLAKGGATAGQ